MRNLVARGATVELHPCTAHGRRAGRRRPRRVLPRQRPRRPGRARATSSTRCASSSARGRCSASASATSCCAAPSAWRPSSCPFGHRGANHPVKDLETGRIEITSQNHGFAVLGPGGARTVDADEPVRWETDFGAAQLSHVNLYDRTVEGLTLLDVPGRDGPVPPRGRARAARLALPLRPLPRPDRRPPRSDAATRRPPQDPDPRLGPDRHRPGRRVRLLRRAGLQGPAARRATRSSSSTRTRRRS